MKRVTNEEVEAARSPKGGWTRATLAKWGVPWPPPRGWRRVITLDHPRKRGQAESTDSRPIRGPKYTEGSDDGSLPWDDNDETPEYQLDAAVQKAREMLLAFDRAFPLVNEEAEKWLLTAYVANQTGILPR